MRKFWNLYREELEEAAEDSPAEGVSRDVIDIDGEIVAGEDWARIGGACYATDFRKALDSVGDVTVRINSPGGDVLAGAEIYSALREHSLNGRGSIRVEIMALAASAASVIAMAGDEILMYPTAYMMIHNPWTGAVGDAREMRKAARTLDEIARGLINAYRIKTGKTEDQLKKMLENETWMSAGTCVAEGFADGIIGGEALERVSAMVMMSGRNHGAGEILGRFAAEDEDPEENPETDPEEEEAEPDEDPEETEARAEETEEDPEETEETGEPEEEPEEEARAEETGEEEPDPEEEPETEETEPDASAEDPEETEEEPETEETEDPEDPEEEEARASAELARIEAQAALAQEILAVRILMGQEMGGTI